MSATNADILVYPVDPIVVPEGWPALGASPRRIDPPFGGYFGGYSHWEWTELVDGVPLRFQRLDDRLYIHAPLIGSAWHSIRVEEIVWYEFSLHVLPAWICGGWRRIERRMARKAARRYRQLQAEQAEQSTPPERLFP